MARVVKVLPYILVGIGFFLAGYVSRPYLARIDLTPIRPVPAFPGEHTSPLAGEETQARMAQAQILRIQKGVLGGKTTITVLAQNPAYSGFTGQVGEIQRELRLGVEDTTQVMALRGTGESPDAEGTLQEEESSVEELEEGMYIAFTASEDFDFYTDDPVLVKNITYVLPD